MSFSFNFGGVSENNNASITKHTGSSETTVKKQQQPEKTGRNSSFTWIRQETFFDSFLQKAEYPENELICVAQRKKWHDDEGDEMCVDNDDGNDVNDYVLRVREASSSFQNNNNKDLVPGVYEGGLKVWECSMDLCRYFHSQKNKNKNIDFKGHVLELGCGHALPSIWILKHAISKLKADCFVTFSDYNDFVVRDVTMQNVAINVSYTYSKTATTVSTINQPRQIARWLKEHVAFGAGDWLTMSDDLLDNNNNDGTKPSAVPKYGLYDYILASETTYSEIAAIETAELLSRHLKPGTGVAYISTKRYYFGVGGGTRCLCDALQKITPHKFHIETLEVYDNGAGNIRELLLVKSLS
jgi:hypothetical protein